MKIQLTRTLPIDPKHGMIEGRILDVTEVCDGYGDGRTLEHVTWYAGCVGVLGREARVVEWEYQCTNCKVRFTGSEDVCPGCGLAIEDVGEEVYPPVRE